MNTSLPSPVPTPFGEYFPLPEILREAISKHLWFQSQQFRAGSPGRNEPFVVLDVFSGDGALALELQRFFPGALVVAKDVVPAAVARLQSEWIEVTDATPEAWVAQREQCDVIVANLPFAKREHHDRIRALFPLLKDHGLLIGLTPAHDVKTVPRKAREFLSWVAEHGEWIDIVPDKYLGIPGVVPPAAVLLRKDLGRRDSFNRPVYGYSSHHAYTIALSLDNGPHVERIDGIRTPEELRPFAEDAAIELLKAGTFVDLREDVLEEVFRSVTQAGRAQAD